MLISSLKAANFKGLAGNNNVSLRPLTLFIGENSSGKSSCLHALAAMSQSVKLHNNRKPLVLDDQYALVHLGRFIDAIHSNSYDDAITLGITTSRTSLPIPSASFRDPHSISCEMSFKTVMATQETYVERATITFGSMTYSVTPSGDRYSVSKAESSATLDIGEFGFGTEVYTYRSAGRLDQDSFELLMELSVLMSTINSTLGGLLYLGPFRDPPGRAYNTLGTTPKEVGARGEATAAMLANEVNQRRNREHLDQISQWLGVLSLGQSISVSRLGASDLFELSVTTDRPYALPDLGYGMSQVLPVLTQCSFAAENSTLLFEQPELHLHPCAARGLVDVFVDIIKQKNCCVIAETHSRAIVQQIQRLIADGTIGVSDVLVYRVKRVGGQSSVKPIDINDDGEVFDNWADGFDQ